MESLKQFLGAQHLYILRAKAKLAVLENDKGQCKKAEKLLRALLGEEACRVYGDHSTVYYVKECLAIAVMSQGKFKKAIKIEKELEGAFAKRPGVEHPRTKKAGKTWKEWEEAYKSIPIWPWSKQAGP